jgi:hypothetical protein
MSSSLNFFRVLYVRVSDDDGKRAWKTIGFIDENGIMTLDPMKWARVGPQAFKNPYKNPGIGIPKGDKR